MSYPEWVMVGLRQGDRYQIYASQTLSQATLEAQVSVNRRAFFATGQFPAVEYTLTTVMAHLVVVEGPSYLEALQKLLRDWQPTSTGPPAIETPTLE